MKPDASFWRGKRVLLTGHTGFKGGWLALWLNRLGAEVTGLALAPATNPNLFEGARIGNVGRSRLGDIRDSAGVAALVRECRPEVVLHLAAQPLVRASYRDPLETFGTNVMGTAHLLDALRGLDSVRAAVVVTTDKVYRNREVAYPYRENDPLGGHDPYSASKAASEVVVESYREAYLAAQGVAVATARAGNVIGGGDWSEDRLIPDAVRAWTAGKPLMIRRPKSVRPWQHVLEPLAGYLRLAEALWADPARAGAYNFGPHTHEAATVGDVIALAREAFGRGDWVNGDGTEGPHEAGWLALEIAHARDALGAEPCWGLQEAVRRTMAWYREQAVGADVRALCDADIDAYEAAGR
jgi:CDP-glucose 4,6-dehydratase